MSLASFIIHEAPDQHRLNLLVEGMHCPSCVAIIENALKQRAEVISARLNLSTRRLAVVWQGDEAAGDAMAAQIDAMGYRVVAFQPETEQTENQRHEKWLLRCLAVAGFASGNLMLLSIPLWTSDGVQMGEATRTLFHWIQGAIAIPAIVYCGQPFYQSAWRALKQRHTNMDVPISIAVILATLMSLFETLTHGTHSYFDSGVMLLFFLLIGRYLETRARGRARSAAQDVLQLMTGTATERLADGTTRTLPLAEITEGMVLLVAAGEKMGADGEIIAGSSEVDTSLITGETLPQAVAVGGQVFAGTMNLSQPIELRVTKAHERSLIAEIVRLMETAEQSQAHYVTLADRISGWYTPVVHALAALTFAGWMLWGDAPWQVALLYAATVLIITCPCALGLAVPVVQVLASGRLMRAGILLKSGSALERLAVITHAVFDKTGTLTRGTPELQQPEQYDASVLQWAASLAAHSKHPLSQAMSKAHQGERLPMVVTEVQGCGLETVWQGTRVRLGKRSWCTALPDDGDAALELWLAVDGQPPMRFTFADQMRVDAAQTIGQLQAAGIDCAVLSGDRPEVTRQIAAEAGIAAYEGGLSPVQKTERIHQMKASGAQVLMVGDGLNDAPSLASATVSMSPTSAMDITQNAADIVFQSERLAPVVAAWRVARHAQQLVRQNFVLAIGYNIIAIPLAVAGMVTPMVAAVAMSSSSLVVIANAMRLRQVRREP